MADVQAFRFDDDGETPNNPRLSLLVYRSAVDLAGEHDPALPFERAFARHGWSDGWRNGIFSFLHFHTTAHEVLGIARGQAEIGRHRRCQSGTGLTCTARVCRVEERGDAGVSTGKCDGRRRQATHTRTGIRQRDSC